MGGIVSFLFGGRGGGTKKNYQRIGELDKQTSKEAEPRPSIWGRVRPISGNIIHLSEASYEMVEIGRREVQTGKNSYETVIDYEERVYRTYAIRICEGPITGITRIWRNNKLVFDARGTTWGDENNSVFAQRLTVYHGSFTQTPSTILEGIWGVGNVPAYRGTAYIIVEHEDLTDLSARVPQYTFEVERINTKSYLTSEVYTWDTVTSMMYGIDSELLEITSTGGGVVEGVFKLGGIRFDDSADATEVTITGGNLRSPLISYDFYEPESADATEVTITGGNLRSPLISYDFYEPEGINATEVTITGGVLKDVLISYDFYEPEGINATEVTITGGNLG